MFKTLCKNTNEWLLCDVVLYDSWHKQKIIVLLVYGNFLFVFSLSVSRIHSLYISLCNK